MLVEFALHFSPGHRLRIFASGLAVARLHQDPHRSRPGDPQAEQLGDNTGNLLVGDGGDPEKQVYVLGKARIEGVVSEDEHDCRDRWQEALCYQVTDPSPSREPPCTREQVQGRKPKGLFPRPQGGVEDRGGRWSSVLERQRWAGASLRSSGLRMQRWPREAGQPSRKWRRLPGGEAGARIVREKSSRGGAEPLPIR